MAVISLVRVGFQTNPTANNGAREALTGAVSGEGTGPFKRINTGLYLANNADGQSVAEALCKLGNRLLEHASSIDMISVIITRIEDDDVESIEADDSAA